MVGQAPCFVFDMVGNPEDRFSHGAAHLSLEIQEERYKIIG